MPSNDKNNFEELASRLKSEAKREAVDSSRGYDWQKWLAVERWLELKGEDLVWIELAEDITVTSDGKATTIQAKDRTSAISLGRQSVRDLIGFAFDRDATVTTIVWTRAPAGVEKDDPFGEAGIEHWKKVVDGKEPPQKLRQFLTSEGRLPHHITDAINAADDTKFRTLLARVEWVTDELAIGPLRSRICALVETRLNGLSIQNASAMREHAANALFAKVAEVGSLDERSERHLSRADLEKVLLSHNADVFNANLPAAQKVMDAQSVSLTTRVVENLIEKGVLPARAANLPVATGLKDLENAALERDLAARFQRAMRRGLFEEVRPADELAMLGDEVLTTQMAGVASNLRRQVLLRAVRSSALRDKLEDARRFLAGAVALAGDTSDKPARARLLVAEGDVDGALRLLRDELDADSFSTLLNILFKNRGAEAATTQYKASGTIAKLTGAGVATVVASYLESGQLATALELLQAIPDAIFRDEPALLMRRGTVALASLFAPQLQPAVQMGVHLDVRGFTPSAPPETLAVVLDGAINDFRRMEAVARELALPRTEVIASSFATWAELLHPDRQGAGLERLKRELAAASSAGLMMLQFAYRFDPQFDPTELSQRLTDRARLGGLSDDEFRAALIVRIHSDEPGDVAQFIATNRFRLYTDFGKEGTIQIEIQALAKAGDAPAARKMLEESRNLFDRLALATLEAEVASAEGADPVESYLNAYNETQSPDALRGLVSALFRAKRWTEFAQRIEQMYALSGDIGDLRDAGTALVTARDDKRFLDLAARHPELVSDPKYLLHAGWARLRKGDLPGANQVAAELRERGNDARDLDLEFAVAVETGDWEALPSIASTFLEPWAKASATELIRAARVVQIVGLGSPLPLLDAAVAAGGDDPRVLIHAYSIVLEEGIEERRPQSANWFKRAVELSGADGPIQQVDIKAVIEESRRRIEVGQDIGAAVAEGSMPLLVAAPGLGASIVDAVLRNLIRNTRQADPRNKIAVHLFSGRRAPMHMAETTTLGLDVSALMTLGWLGLLPVLGAAYPKIVLAAGSMSELFDGQRRAQERQKSQFTRARALQEATGSGRIKVVPRTARWDDLEKLVGSGLASLLRTAEANGGVVVRPPPVHQLGDIDRNADLTAYASRLADMHGLLQVLIDHGATELSLEEQAKRSFDVQCEKWPAAAVPDIDQPLYLDDLAVIFLHMAGLLDVVTSTFSSVWVAEESVTDAARVAEDQGLTPELISKIADIRTFVRDGLKSGRVVVGPQRSDSNASTRPIEASALNMLSDLSLIDALVFDDRAINKEPFAADNGGRRVPVVSTLDVIEHLYHGGAIDRARRDASRYQLRRGAAVLVPFDAEELTAAVQRNRAGPSREYAAIQESIDFLRMTEIPVFPTEIPWLAGGLLAVKNAVQAVWNTTTDMARAEVLANQLVSLRMMPGDWVFGWRENPPSDWAEAVVGAFYAAMTLPFGVKSEVATEAYKGWVERTLLEGLRENNPDRYKRLLDYVAALIRNNYGKGDGDGE